ncbi:hypothetical protein MSG28_001089 [Choristoneura fumiferana]|uniref:Uncharacterized protein n=1 Tax=Choristoneura fumiferana TaxID=7141 RepID=A0ACC0K412_CHOFU|nr:hypothetical protein MSG28_001089 [Choristoneura fumiferana]
MLSLVVCFCSITIIFNVKIVKPNLTATEEPIINATTTTEFTEPTARTIPPSTTPSLDNYDWDIFCKFQPNGYDCLNDGIGSTRYYYDVKAEECKQFVFGGCGGNQRNIFLNMKDCRQTCKDPGKKPIDEYHYPNVFCRLQPEFGGCSDYNPIGCGGNQNKFVSQNLCHQVCEDTTNAYGKQTCQM